ncbi:MAG: hypothetical protein ACTH30_01050 [Leucobacter sp.]
MPRSRTRLRALALPLCVATPLGIVVALNALVRPRMAEALGGTRVSHFTNYRSADGWWEFAEPVSASHPVAARFLGFSDGAIAMTGIAVAVLACAALLASDRIRQHRAADQT